MIYRFFLAAAFAVSIEVNRGRLATASDKILTQEYTAVICMAERSVTALPEVVPPKKKR